MAYQQSGGGFQRQMYQGNWKCSKCSAEITELPFNPDPSRLDQLQCQEPEGQGDTGESDTCDPRKKEEHRHAQGNGQVVGSTAEEALLQASENRRVDEVEDEQHPCDYEALATAQLREKFPAPEEYELG